MKLPQLLQKSSFKHVCSKQFDSTAKSLSNNVKTRTQSFEAYEEFQLDVSYMHAESRIPTVQETQTR